MVSITVELANWTAEHQTWRATAVFLELNDASVSAATDDDVYEPVIMVAVDDIEIDQIAASRSEEHTSELQSH